MRQAQVAFASLDPRRVNAELGAYVNQLTRCEGLESFEESGYQGAERVDPVCLGNEDDDGNWEGAEVLLVLQILIGRQQRVEVGAASCSSPFRLPAHPISPTVRTSWSDSKRASGRGSDSSSRRRTGSQEISG